VENFWRSLTKLLNGHNNIQHQQEEEDEEEEEVCYLDVQKNKAS
ncbi:hypothetical protein GBF38_010310, partial [Nibea albiflora]